MPWLRGLDELINLTPVFSKGVAFDSRGRELRVDIFRDGRLEQALVPLSDCFPDDPEAYAAARVDLISTGKHRCGGGAQPVFELRRCR